MVLDADIEDRKCLDLLFDIREHQATCIVGETLALKYGGSVGRRHQRVLSVTNRALRQQTLFNSARTRKPQTFVEVSGSFGSQTHSIPTLRRHMMRDNGFNTCFVKGRLDPSTQGVNGETTPGYQVSPNSNWKHCLLGYSFAVARWTACFVSLIFLFRSQQAYSNACALCRCCRLPDDASHVF